MIRLSHKEGIQMWCIRKLALSYRIEKAVERAIDETDDSECTKSIIRLIDIDIKYNTDGIELVKILLGITHYINDIILEDEKEYEYTMSCMDSNFKDELFMYEEIHTWLSKVSKRGDGLEESINVRN